MAGPRQRRRACGSRREVGQCRHSAPPKLSWLAARFVAGALAGQESSSTQAEAGPVFGAPGEKWWNISAALRDGRRGQPGGSSLPRLLEKHRGVRNRGRLARLSVRQILTWADAPHARTGRWPTALSGAIAGTPGETWRGIDHCLQRGTRSLPGGTSLARVMAEHRGYRNVHDLPRLETDQTGRRTNRARCPARRRRGRGLTMRCARGSGASRGARRCGGCSRPLRGSGAPT